jgi:hypothetical protein
MSDLTPSLRLNAGLFILIVNLVFSLSTRFFLGRPVIADEVDPSILRLRAAPMKALYGVALERKGQLTLLGNHHPKDRARTHTRNAVGHTSR